MAKKELTVTCPCCDSRLVVDVLTERVITHSRRVEADSTGRPVLTEADWDSANTKVSGRISAAEDRFDQALSSERTRGQDLDALFDKLKRKPEPDEEQTE